MNKRLFYYLFAVLCTVTLFTSCSDDDGDDIRQLFLLSKRWQVIIKGQWMYIMLACQIQ